VILPNEVVIDDDNYTKFLRPGGFGLIPRPMDAYPVGSYATSVTYEAIKDALPLIPWADMPELIRERVSKKMQISDLRNVGLDGGKAPNFHQGNSNFCWFYAAAHGLMLSRVMDNLPYVRFSPHAGGCKIKGFANRGGWSAHAAEFIAERGCPTVKTWPHQSWSRSNDNAETWAEAQLYRTTEGWIDLDAPEYNRDLSKQQTLTLLIYGIPCPVDIMQMGHAMCAMDAVDAYPSKSATDPSRYGIRVLDSYPQDTRILTQSMSTPSNACGMRAPLIVA
jgi:hypothetical protein